MRARRVEAEPVEPDEIDVGLFESCKNAFSMTPTIRSGLKYLSQDIEPILKDLVNRDAAFKSLEETIGSLGSRYDRFTPPDIKTMMASMLVSIIKQTNTSRGSADPVYMEEVEWMMSQDAGPALNSFRRCLGTRR